MRRCTWLNMMARSLRTGTTGLLLAALALFLLAVAPAAADDYYSLYSYGRPVEYCSAQSCRPGDDSCQEKAYPCVSGNDIYRYTERRMGFKDIYNPHDPKVTCGSETDMSCIDGELTLSLNLTTMTSIVKEADLVAFPDGFRFYLPPGTTYASATVYTPRDTKEGMVVRFGRQPDCKYCQYAWQLARYDQVPWQPYTQISLADLTSEDVYMSTLGGHAEVLPTMAFDQPLAAGEAGWVYVHRLPFSGDEIYAVQVTIRVNYAAYVQWYDRYQEWDSAGDPWSAESGGVSPPRTSTCSQTDLEACTTRDLCVGVGAYWYDNACNDQPLCEQQNLDACTSEADCVASGFNWYDDACHVEPRCRADNPGGCESQTECESIDKYWYDGACHAAPACTVSTIGHCTTKEQCTASGFYWNDADEGICQESPPCGAEHLEACTREDDCLQAGGEWDGSACRGHGCSPTNLDACDSSLSCAQQGGIWYYDQQTCNEPQCGPYELFSCLNATDCREAGGYWDGRRCQDPASNQTCSPTNLSACTDAIHCGLANGVWNGSSCGSSSSAGGGGGGGITPLSCGAGHLDYCTTQSLCEAAGGSWDGYGCTESAGGGQEPVSGGCDQLHRTACTSEASCDKASGFWYDNSCHTVPAPKVTPTAKKTQEVVDYQDRLGDAWVQLGAGALDGELNAGDQVELHLQFPRSEKSVQRYAGIIIGGRELYFIDNQGESLLSADITPLQGNSFSSLDQSLLPVPWDACGVLGAEYQGDWLVFFLTVDGNSRFQDLADLEKSLADSSYYLGYYQVQVDCSKQAPLPVLAVPDQALPALSKGVEASATVVTAAAGPLLLQPTLTVAPEDVGKTAGLFAHISYPHGGGEFDFPGPSLTLAAAENFAQIFANPVNYTGKSGTVLDLYFGYVLNDGTQKYNAYEIKIQ